MFTTATTITSKDARNLRDIRSLVATSLSALKSLIPTTSTKTRVNAHRSAKPPLPPPRHYNHILKAIPQHPVPIRAGVVAEAILGAADILLLLGLRGRRARRRTRLSKQHDRQHIHQFTENT